MLLAKRTKPPFQWSLPGGKRDPDESAEANAIREAREEVSVGIEIAGYVGEREFSIGDKRFVISVFAARLVSGEPKTGPEAGEVGWFDLAEIEALHTTEELAAYVDKARRLVLGAKT